MQTVFTNAMTAHVWAQQSQERGHSGSLSFAGDTLSSYGTPIARIVKGRGGPVCLLTSRRYSVTTSGHCSQARRAFAGSVFTVPMLGASGGGHREEPHDCRGRYAATVNHRANLAYLEKQYRQAKLRLTRRLSLYQPVAESLRYEAEQLAGYAAAFGFKRVLDVAADAAAVEAARAEREARLSTPAALARRERERAKRDARHAEQVRLKSLVAAERQAAWRTGRLSALGYGEQCAPGGSAMLRRKGAAEVETSLGVVVPLADVLSAFERVARCRAAGIEWARNGEQVPVGRFQLDRIEANGDVHAGCHFIAWEEASTFCQAVKP